MNDAGAIQILTDLLESRTGQRIAPERYWRIEAALKPLMRAEGAPTLAQLTGRLANGRDPAIAEAVIEALINKETSFFRDRATFRQIDRAVLEELRAARAGIRRIRIWCAGCSTGQEAYSLALGFAAAGGRWTGWRIEIVATDISAHAIDQATRGAYSQFEIQRGLPVATMVRWFEQQEDGWIARHELRRTVRFVRQNLLAGPPAAGGFDLILCRNVLLYFLPEVRLRAFGVLAGAIAPDGVLVLGAGETVIGQTEAFAASRRWRGFYRPQGCTEEEGGLVVETV